ncbi:MAG: SprB repeat-containing protein, partial [Flavobacteriales bacterium]|nr:SprB repeat-containing protein [Flavobacteriales bacterium]
AGTFRFTFTDSTGASIVDSVIIVEPPVLTTAFSDSSIISCSGDSSGFATVGPSGGIPAYTYLWDDPAAQTTASATGLVAGTYTVVVTDNRTCTDPASIAIIQVGSTPLLVNISDTTNLICNGIAIGATTVSTSGGTTPYTFLWNDANAQTDSIATGLLAGTYAVAITDSVGCPGADTVIITEPAALNLAIIDSNTASCGSTDAFAAVTVTGGYAPYTYLWDDPSVQTLDTATALASGTYKVIVTDSTGCIDSAQANLVDFSGPTISITNSTNVLCFGSGGGSATVTPSGGAPPYIYSWSPSGSTDSTANFLSAGVHTVTVIDNAPCTSVISVTITEPPVFTATLTDSVDILCFGDSTGTATVTPVGGVPPYTYTWSNGDTDSIADSLLPGSYTVIIGDANTCNANGGAAMSNCFEIRSILVDACNPSGPESDNEMVRFEIGASDLNTSTLVVDWPNNNWDGLCQNIGTSDIVDSINANIVAGGNVLEPVGGVLPAGAQVMLITSDAFDWTSHDWSALNYTIYLIFQCDGNFSGHFKNADCACGTCANDRVLSLDFGGGCTDTVSYVPCTLDAVSGGANGDEVEYADDGTPTYQNIGCLPPVVLAVQPLSVTISQPASAVAASITGSANILCFGDSIGTANSDGSGGIPPYTYLWNDPAAQTDSNATSLKAGTFKAYVTDNNGCVDSTTVTITEPASALVASKVDSTDLVCKGVSTGTVEVGAGGGTSPYTYLWNDPSSQTTVIASSLLAGSYTAVVTDFNGCQDSISISILEPLLFTINTTALVDAHCGQFDGSATVSSAGGTLPHVYLWDDPSAQTDTVATGLAAGTYKVIFTDALGCRDSLTLVLNDLAGPGINSFTTSTVLCNGDSTGTISVQAGGGNAPLTYLWDDASAQTDSLATGLPAATYNVTVTDFFGCLTVGGGSVSELTTLSLGTSSTPTSCGATDGTATVNASGGALSFTYAWNTAPVQTDSIATGLAGGSYTVVVTDTNGCLDSTNVTVVGLTNPIITMLDSVDVACNGDSTGSITSTVAGGTTPYTYLWDDVGAQTDSMATGLPNGIYKLLVTAANGCQDSASVSLGEPVVLSAAITDSSATNCSGDSSGYATVTPAGGLGAYTYLWDDANLQTDSVADGLPAGTYIVVVTDSTGCEVTVFTSVVSPLALSFSTNSTNANCGLSDGSATAIVSGGTSPYTYSWNTSPVQTDTIATGLGFGTYTMVVLDSLGCTDSTAVGVSNSGGPTLAITDGTDVLCNGDSTGSATVTPIGGTAPYVYLWNDINAQTDSTAINLMAGTYNVNVSDGGGCGSVATVTITESSAFVLIMSSVSTSCFGDSSGSAKVSTSGATPPYSFLWDDFNTQTDSVAIGLPAGTYNVIVSDSFGCSSGSSIIVTEPAALVLSTFVTAPTCAGDSSGSATVSTIGGTGPFTYLWDDASAQTNSTATGLPAAVYSVNVTDAGGCTGSVAGTITDPALSVLSFSTTLAACGDSSGSATVTISGGTSPFTYVWNDPGTQTDSIATGLYAATFSVTVTD